MTTNNFSSYQAQQYLIDPFSTPEPSEETGPGSHFNSSIPHTQPSSFGRSSSTKKTPKTIVNSYPTPPASASPTKSTFSSNNPYASHRQSAFSGYSNINGGSLRKSLDGPVGTSSDKGRRRGSSLGGRYPGDMSHRPLDQLRQETKIAYRSPHLRKKHIPGADIIDSLDRTAVGGSYHHEGPYDATLMARNTSYKSSPVAAVAGTNEEAIRATPRENIQDSLDRHIPLSGTADVPPGMPGPDGVIMNYAEGADLMREPDAAGGAYKRYDHVKYLPEDYKGKGEPSFSIDQARKDHKASQKPIHRRIMSDGNFAYEMQTRSPSGVSNLRPPPTNRQRSVSGSNAMSGGIGGFGAMNGNSTGKTSGRAMGTVDFSGDEGKMKMNTRNRSHSPGRSHNLSEGLKRRFGSLKRSFKGGE
ncbi:hypothetical protein SBOR_2279 [Sclerotinia borealis F-4128]|uniref:Pal1 cell morphology protein n=1 Tax=Sclerotinia borealis (strain F-4128) TaxID=1432307 RepID=W9CS03_SCLBF|nr:hypothetical protein SBOR_2279 [Sclerotinia borealis F-4128]